jgi:hypothetical protein
VKTIFFRLKIYEISPEKKKTLFRRVGDNGFFKISIFNFYFPNLFYTQSGNHLEENLAKLGSISHVKFIKKGSFYIFGY